MSNSRDSNIDIIKNWQKIKLHFDKVIKRNLHVVFSSVDKDNNPLSTPIGTLFFNKDQTGFYFEKFSKSLASNIGHNANICVLAVNSNKFMWLKASLKGRFSKYPGLKLYGKLGERREATDREVIRLHRRIKFTQGLKGNIYLWGDMKHVREIRFEWAEKINLGKMTKWL